MLQRFHFSVTVTGLTKVTAEVFSFIRENETGLNWNRSRQKLQIKSLDQLNCYSCIKKCFVTCQSPAYNQIVKKTCVLGWWAVSGAASSIAKASVTQAYRPVCVQCAASGKWRIFKAKVRPYHNLSAQHFSQASAFTLQVNVLHFWCMFSSFTTTQLGGNECFIFF